MDAGLSKWTSCDAMERDRLCAQGLGRSPNGVGGGTHGSKTGQQRDRQLTSACALGVFHDTYYILTEMLLLRSQHSALARGAV